MINLLMNVLWLLLFGWNAGLAWLTATIVMVVSIVGIPWARAAFNIALFMFWPFGRVAVARDDLTGREDIGTGPLGFIGNVIWFLFGGIWLGLGHLLIGLVCCITVIGIPFGLQHFKFAGLAFAPIGKTIVDREVLEAVRYR
ncbi:YccF domain-containing protein [Niveispirillum sp.]|uniref:YccF domain-containing protein n=1 Tax=Niveispirillum sp. TaxID=1917217 RepID=UPI001B54D1E5|nr:YccF domain-containing protein [Niveispirillum sp.]MBP7340280.1 YccF domain-containing protein [Niveispirillum sp.]